MTKGTFQLRGLDAYLEEIAKAGEDIDQVVTEVLNENRDPAGGLMYQYLRRTSEEWTGAAARTLFVTPVQQDGNYIFFELGADVSRDPAALYKEHGTARQNAEPFLKPTFSYLRRKTIKQMLQQVMDRLGISTK